MNLEDRALRVLLVDDHPMVRAGIRTMLTGDPGIRVVGEASTGDQALELIDEFRPDVVLMDIRMPGMSGIEVTRRIKAQHPMTAVVMVTMYEARGYVVEALRAGAAGYIVKDSSRELLRHAISSVVEGGSMVRSDLLRQAIRAESSGQQGGAGAGSGAPVAELLTERELTVLALVARGYLNKEIARDLSLAEVTVKKHIHSIMAKLGVSDRTNAAIAAVRLGLAE